MDQTQEEARTMANAWSRHAAALALSAAVLIGGVSYGVVTYAQAPVLTPRTAEGKPDLSGIWVPSARGGAASKYDEFGGETVFAARDNSFENFENDNALRRLGDRNKPLYKPEHWAKVRENDANGNELDPEFKCRTYGVPRMGAPSQIVQTKDQVVLLYAGGFAGQNTFRVVPTDGRPHNQARVTQETWKGDPVGHWEGDTLVIETIGFRDGLWADYNGSPVTDQAKITERFRRVNFGMLEVVVTVDDPKAYTKPWTVTLVQNIVLNDDLLEYVCLENEKDVRHMVGK
jgi:hypothetical protein